MQSREIRIYVRQAAEHYLRQWWDCERNATAISPPPIQGHSLLAVDGEIKKNNLTNETQTNLSLRAASQCFTKLKQTLNLTETPGSLSKTKRAQKCL